MGVESVTEASHHDMMFSGGTIDQMMVDPEDLQHPENIKTAAKR